MLDNKYLLTIFFQENKNSNVLDIYNENKYLTELSINNDLIPTKITCMDMGYSIRTMEDDIYCTKCYSENSSGLYSLEDIQDIDVDYIMDFLAKIKSLQGVKHIAFCNITYTKKIKILKKNLSIIEDIQVSKNAKIDIIVQLKYLDYKFLSYYLTDDLNFHFKEIKSDIERLLSLLITNITFDKKYDIVFNSAISGSLIHEAIGHLMEADYYVNNEGFYNKRKKFVSPSYVNIIDCGYIENPYLKLNYDDKCNECFKKYIIKNGILNDNLNTNKFKHLCNPCNARRESFRSDPLPRMSNTYLDKGIHKKEEIISSLFNGIFINNFMGGITNPITGDFLLTSNNSFLVKGGELVNSLNNIIISGNSLDFLNNIESIANDLNFIPGFCGKKDQFIPVTMGAPTILVKKSIYKGQLNGRRRFK